MNPGHSTDTPIPRGASSRRRPSDSATTPYLETLYALLSPEIRPAIEAVETMCPPSPCCSISGPKISIPQMVAIRLTPMVQFHDASVQAPYGPPPPTPAAAARVVDEDMHLAIAGSRGFGGRHEFGFE